MSEIQDPPQATFTFVLLHYRGLDPDRILNHALHRRLIPLHDAAPGPLHELEQGLAADDPRA